MNKTSYIVEISDFVRYSGIAWNSKEDAEKEKNQAINDGFKDAYIIELNLSTQFRY